jgi:hypothetical protein
VVCEVALPIVSSNLSPLRQCASKSQWPSGQSPSTHLWVQKWFEISSTPNLCFRA